MAICAKNLGLWVLVASLAWSCGADPDSTAENTAGAGSSAGGNTTTNQASSSGATAGNATNGTNAGGPGAGTSASSTTNAGTDSSGNASGGPPTGATDASDTTATGTNASGTNDPPGDTTTGNDDDAAPGSAVDDPPTDDGSPADEPSVDPMPDDGMAMMDPPGDPGATVAAGPTTPVSAADLLAQGGLGWNLGNSLDAPEGETAWGNPEVSETLIDAVAGAGFGLIRIPVSWSLHMGPAPDFTIDAAWLNRVEEIVGFVTSRGLLAVINAHHDGADGMEGVEWLSLNDASGAITAEHDAAVDAQFTRMWEQLAARFEAHGDLLLFEGMNEIHDGYDTPPTEYLVRINELNQLFVDIVRESGGNNAQRALIVPGYNTNIDHTLSGFELPTDSAADKLALSVHFYDPWSFAGEASTNTWGAASPDSDTWGQEDFVVEQFDRLQAEYIAQGVAVMMGEYGAVSNTGYENYRRYYMEYVTKAAVDRGIVPVYWDNGGMGSGPDKFALFDRSTATVTEQELLDAILRAATMEYALADVALP